MQIPLISHDYASLADYLFKALLIGGNAYQFVAHRKQRNAETRRVDVDTVEKLTRMFNDLLDKGEARRAQFDIERDGFKAEIAVLEERMRVGEEERESLREESKLLREENIDCRTEMKDIKDRLQMLETVRDTDPLGK